MFFEAAREQAEKDFHADNKDALVREEGQPDRVRARAGRHAGASLSLATLNLTNAAGPHQVGRRAA